jgi:integrase
MSVRKRGDKWVVRTYDPRLKKPVWVGTFDRKGEATEAEQAAKAELKKHRRGLETCDSFANRWVDDYPRPRESTNMHNRERVKRFADDFKGRPLGSIDRVEARQWAMKHRAAHASVRAMFTNAFRDGLVDENPFANLGLTQSRGRRDLVVSTAEEVRALADAAKMKHGPIIEAFVLTAAYTGMRPGEMYALRWECVDLEGYEIDVVASFSHKSGQTTRPKNSQKRRIVLPPPARDALAALPRKADGFVFHTHHGKRLTGAAIHYYWDPVRTACGKPSMNLYEMRHFCASYLLNDLKLPAQDVAHQLGHTDGGVLVMKLYGHASESLARHRIHRAFGANVKPLREVKEGSG